MEGSGCAMTKRRLLLCLAVILAMVLVCCGAGAIFFSSSTSRGRGYTLLVRRPVPRMAAKGELSRFPGLSVPQLLPAPEPEPEPAPPASSHPEPPPAAAAKTPVQEAPGVDLPYPGVITEAPIPPGCYSPSGIEEQVMALINEERERLGIPPLKLDENLAVAAHVRAAELYTCDYFAHQRPNGDPWNTILDIQVVVEYSNAAENLAWSNQPVGEDVEAQRWFDLWKNSPSHYAAMTDPIYSHFGLAILSCPRSSVEEQSFAVTLFCSY